MRTIITFLGLAPKLTQYQHQGNIYTGEVFAQALRQFCPFDRMLVCVTPEARANTLPLLTALADPRIEPVDIPKGETTAEMWETFNVIAQRIQLGDEVTFDITHGLRSLPFLVFLFAAYLKSAKKAQIAAIYYGAYDLAKEKGGIAPVIDLSEFSRMLDWLSATDRFVETGNGQSLAGLLRSSVPEKLNQAADTIEDISLALAITSPVIVMESTAKLRETLQAVEPEIQENAPPFALLSEQVIRAYGQFALSEPEHSTQIAQSLRKQLKMLKWYVAHQQTTQAVTLAIELLISVICFHIYQGISDNQRRKIRATLNALKNGTAPPSKRCATLIQELQNSRKLVSLWQETSQLRNNINHAAVSKSSPRTIHERVEHLASEISKELQSILDGTL
jgi:CRISPR-associated DxTHG motif protein